MPSHLSLQLFCCCRTCMCQTRAGQSMPRHVTQWHMPLIMKILAKHFPGQRPKAADGWPYTAKDMPKYPCAHLPATCIKFKVFTAMLPLHFAQKLYFVRRIHGRQTQTLLHLLTLYGMYWALQLGLVLRFSFVWFGCLVSAPNAAPAPIGLADIAATLSYSESLFLSFFLCDWTFLSVSLRFSLLVFHSSAMGIFDYVCTYSKYI